MNRMEWFYNSKVQFALWVNLFFVLYTLMAPVSPDRRGVYATSLYGTSACPFPFAPLPPPAAPPKSAVVDLGGGRANVLLTKDLTLVNKPGRTLVFSPSFGVSTLHPEPPDAVTLRFMIFTEKEACPGSCMLVVNADGTHVWESPANGTFSTGWTREKAPSTTMTLPDGQVAVTLAAETLTTQIPYTTFIDIISSNRVVLSLGPDKVELTPDQMDALRDMHRRVAPPPAVDEQRPKIIKAF